MKVFKAICNLLSTLIIIALAAIAIVLLVPRFMGKQTLAVLSGSMEPNIPVGAIVITEEVEPETIAVGDVITYRLSGDTMVTHRVTVNDKTAKQLTTKGDANNVEDGSPVSYNQVVGHVAGFVPFIGYIAIYIRTPLGIAGICAVLFVLILLTFLPEVLSKAGKKEEK